MTDINQTGDAITSPVVYCINRENILCSFNEEWDRFALSNNSDGIVAGKLLGTNLLDHISDDTLRHLTEQLIDKVRKEAVTISLPMRCDSPDVIREMTIGLSPGDSGEVQFVVKLLRAELREPVTLLDPEAERSGNGVGPTELIELAKHFAAYEDRSAANRAFLRSKTAGK
jgi:hypothetical protein